MSDKDKSSPTSESFSNQSLWQLVRAAMILALVILVSYPAYFWLFKGYVIGEPEVWGLFGDYIGGMLNPVFSFFALLILVISLRASVVALKQNEVILEQTKQELILTRKQIKDNEAALKKQASIARLNAYTERLGGLADRVYGEIMDLLTSKKLPLWKAPGHMTERVAPTNHIMIEAFDPNFHITEQFATLQEIEKIWDPFENPEIFQPAWIFKHKLLELDDLCDKVRFETETDELSVYYANRLHLYITGAESLGFLFKEEFPQLNVNVVQSWIQFGKAD